MEENISYKEMRQYKIDPPREATATTILNNIGNGAMLGALPSIVVSLYNEMTGKIIDQAAHKTRGKIGIGMTVVGSLLGAVYGVREAKRLQSYRHAVSDRLAEVEAKVNTVSSKWQNRQESANPDEKAQTRA